MGRRLDQEARAKARREREADERAQAAIAAAADDLAAKASAPAVALVPDGTLSVERWATESEIAHRAFLLYAMQDPSRRSKRAVGRATGRAEPTIRMYDKKHGWEHRLRADQADLYAIANYRALYLAKYGTIEIPHVADNMTLPLSASPKKPGEAADATKLEKDIAAADSAVQREVLDRRENRRVLREKHVALVDAGIGYVVQELRNGKIRANLRDIPVLLQIRGQLDTDSDAVGAVGQAGLAVETVRVRAAREKGTDLLDAMLADHDEVGLILDVLRTRRLDTADATADQPIAVGAPDLRLVQPVVEGADG